MATTFTPNVNSRVAEYPPTGARRIISGTLVTTGGDGAAAGDIPASLFGLSKIEEGGKAVKSDNTVVTDTAPSYDGTSLLTLGAPDGGCTPSDLASGTYAITVKGY